MPHYSYKNKGIFITILKCSKIIILKNRLFKI